MESDFSIVMKYFIDIILFFVLVNALDGIRVNRKNPLKVIEKGCGIPSIYPSEVNGIEPLIVGGRDATVGMFPWVGYLGFYRPNSICCTVSLLNPLMAITAGHCVAKKCSRDAYVVFGVVNNQVLPSKNVFKVKRFYHHKNFIYEQKSSSFDLAIVELERPVDLNDFNGTVNTVCLAESAAAASTEFVQAGWGEMSLKINYNKAADKLEYMISRSVSKRRCPSETVFCVKGKRTNQTPYKGDSGGPAMLLKNGRYYLNGVLSQGDTRIAVYVSVKHFIDWICHYNQYDVVVPTCTTSYGL